MPDNTPCTQLTWPFDSDADGPATDADWGATFARARSLQGLHRRLTRFEARREEAARQGDTTAQELLRLTSFDVHALPRFAPRPPSTRSPLGLILSWDATHVLLRVAGARVAPAGRWLLLPRTDAV